MNIVNSNSRIAKNSVLLSVRMVIVTFISIFTTRFLLKNLGVEDFGVYNVTLGIVSLCTFLTPAFANAIQRFYNFELGKNGVEGAKKVFISSIQIQIVLILLIILICETVGLWYVKERLVVSEGRQNAALWIFHISVIAFSLSMLQVPFVSSVLAHEKMNFFAVVNVLDSIFKLTIAIGIAFSSFDRLVVYGVLLLCINLFDIVLYGFYSYCHFKEIRFEFIVDKSLVRGLLFFSGWNVFETVARIAKDQGGNLLLNFYFGPILNAARGITNQVSYAFASIVDSTVMSARPQMVIRYAKGNIQNSLLMFLSLSKGTLLLIFILGLPVFLDAEYILYMWLGEGIPAYSVELVRLSIIFLLIDKLASPVTALIHATGKVKRYHLFSGLMNILVIPFSWLFFSLGYAPTSLYIITIIGALVAQIVFLFIIKELLPFSIKDYITQVCYPFFCVMIISLWVPLYIEMNMSEGLIRFVSVTITSLMVSLFVAYLIALNKSEKRLLLSLFNQN